MKTFKLISKIALAIMLLALSIPTVLVSADNVTNDISANPGKATITAGESSSVLYKIVANNAPQGDPKGSDVNSTCPATVTIVKPAAVTATPASLTFTEAGVDQTVVFTSTTPGDYAISVTVSGGIPGSLWNINPANFTLHVVAAPPVIPSDTTPPVITNSISGTLGSNGWHTSDVAVTFSASDPESAITSTTPSSNPYTYNLNSDTAGTTVTYSATSEGGTSTDSVTVKIDKEAPVITATVSPTPNAAGWDKDAVIVTFTATDVGPSDLATVTAPITITDEGTTTVTGYATDNAGNTGSIAVTVNIDKTKPVVSATVSPAPNTAGWNKDDVTVAFTATDVGGSGVDLSTVTAPITITDEGTTTITGYATDNAGNTGSVAVTVNLDKTAPTITGAPDRTANANGWYNADVTVTFTPDDALSGVDTCTAPVTLTEGADQSVTGTVTDKAGNSASATVSGINIDETAPTISGTPDRAANANGWYKADVTVTFTPGDALSGVDTCTAPVTLTEGAAQSVTGTVIDLAGNSASTTVSGINIDKTAPTISGAPDRAANANGWYNAAVTVTFTPGDALSGVDTWSLPVALGEGTGQSVTGTVTDKAGNSAFTTVSGINIDGTAPIITITTPADGSSYTFKQTILANWSATDGLSGIDTAVGTTASGSPINTASLGSKTFTVSATDLAGNSASKTAGYTVVPYKFGGWNTPISISLKDFNKMSTIPVKLQLFDTAGKPVANAIVHLSVNGKPAASSGSSNSGDLFRYDPSAQQYIFNLAASKSLLTQGTNTLVVKLDDGTSYTTTITIK